MMEDNAYMRLAEALDALPNGFPPTEDGAELRLLTKLFTPDEAELAAQLRFAKETPEAIARRLGRDKGAIRQELKGLARKGLIAAGKTPEGLAYGLLPFVVGIYEMQAGRVDVELASLFEDYYQVAFGRALAIEPSVHRVIPVNESVRMDLAIEPFESVSDIVARAKAWGVLDCICRTQTMLVGKPCIHPLDVCMTMSRVPGAFDNNPVIQALSQEEALATLERAARAGLVHSVSNNQEGLWYICNCCTCSCGILRGLSELGIANAVAHSSFVNSVVDETLCTACGLCLEYCQFEALSLDGFEIQVDEVRCVGCGVCVQFCQDEVLALVERPLDAVKPVPATEAEWRARRAVARGIEWKQMI
jgi:electron transport complex protein RnfB